MSSSCSQRVGGKEDVVIREWVGAYEIVADVVSSQSGCSGSETVSVTDVE